MGRCLPMLAGLGQDNLFLDPGPTRQPLLGPRSYTELLEGKGVNAGNPPCCPRCGLVGQYVLQLCRFDTCSTVARVFQYARVILEGAESSIYRDGMAHVM